MKCVKCGCNLEDDARFCYECGAAVEQTSTVTESVVSPQENAGQEIPVNPTPVQNTPYQQWNTSEESVKTDGVSMLKTDTNIVNKVFMVVGGIIAVIYILAAIGNLIPFFPAAFQILGNDRRGMILFTLISCVLLFLTYVVHFAGYLVYALGFAVIGLDFKKEKANSGFCMIIIGVIVELLGSIFSFVKNMLSIEDIIFSEYGYYGAPSTFDVLSGSFSGLGDMLLYGAFMFALLSVVEAMPFVSNKGTGFSDMLKNIPNDVKDTYAATKNKTAKPNQTQQNVQMASTGGMNNACPPPTGGMNNTCPPPAGGMNNACPPPAGGMNNAYPPPAGGMNNACPPPAGGMNNGYAQNNMNNGNYQAGQYHPSTVAMKLPLKSDRSLLMYILLTIVTCGIYSLFFIHKWAKDINEACAGDGKNTAGLLQYILLNIVTCGIYGWIWNYQLGNRLAENARRYNLMFSENGTTVLMWDIFGILVCGIGPLMALHILIKNSNSICVSYNRMNNL